MLGKDGFIGTTIAAYNPRGRSTGALIRVITMILIILVRTVHVCVYIARSAIRGRLAALIVGCIFGIIGTIVIAICIAQIGAAQGKRRVLGINWGRWHFDAVLAITLVISIVLLVFALLTGGRTRNNGLFAAWCILWVFVAIFAWIANKAGVTESYV